VVRTTHYEPKHCVSVVPTARWPQYTREGEWVQLDLGEVQAVTGVVLAGDKSNNTEFLTGVTLSVSRDGTGNFTVLGTFGTGLSDAAAGESAYLYFPAGAVAARFVRVSAHTWSKSIALRASAIIEPTAAMKAAVLIDSPEHMRDYSSAEDFKQPGQGFAQSSLDSNRGWVAAAAKAGEWLRVDLGRKVDVRGIAVMGRADDPSAFPTEVRVSLTDDPVFPETAAPGDNDGLFATGLAGGGRFEQANLMFNGPAVSARYVTIAITAWNGSTPALRVGVYVDAAEALPSVDTIDPEDSARTYSSSLLGSPASMLAGSKAWTAASTVPGEWLQMDLGVTRDVSGVALQLPPVLDASNGYTGVVRRVKVQVGDSPDNLLDIPAGPMDTGMYADDKEPVELVFPHAPVQARYVRVVVLEVSGEAAKAPAARLGGAVQEEEYDRYTTATLGDEDEEVENEVEVEDDTHLDSGLGLSGAAGSLIAGASIIATADEFNFITEAINTGEKMTDMWVKCYDSETDTHDAATFHTNCNNRGATVTLIKTTDEKRVAAFSPLSYGSGSNSQWVNAPEAVIINLDTKKVNRLFPRSERAMMDSPTYGPSLGYGSTASGPLRLQNDMTTIKCGYWSTNFPRTQEMKDCIAFIGGASKHEAQYLEVWALKTASTVTAGEHNSSIASQEDFVRMTNAIRRFRPSLERSEHDSVTPVPGMWEKCFDFIAPFPASTPASTGPKNATYRGDDHSNIVDNDEIDWIVGEISADFGSPLTALVHKCYDRDVDALTSQEWHARCNNFGATLTFIELINGKKIAIFLPDSMRNSRYQRGWKSSSMFTVNGNGRDLPLCAYVAYPRHEGLKVPSQPRRYSLVSLTSHTRRL